MRHTKIKRTLLGTLSVFFLAVSCSEDNGSLELEEVNASVNLTNNSDAVIIVDAVYNASDAYNNPRLLDGVDQATVDEFIEKYNLDKLSTGAKIEAANVNQIISEVGRAYEIGLDRYIATTSYASFTKEILLIQITGSSVPDLTKRRGFDTISDEEQNMLLLNNAMLQEFERRNGSQGQTRINCNGTDDPAGCIVGTWVGSTIGNAVGTSVCGPICGAVGGAIGGIIGGAIGGKE